MRDQAGFFDLNQRSEVLSADGDALETLSAVVEFELFRPDLARAVPRSDGEKSGRPPFDLVLIFKVSMFLDNHSLSDEQTDCLIKDQLLSCVSSGSALPTRCPLPTPSGPSTRR